MSEQLKGHLDGLILSVLEAGPVHGYQVIVLLRERSDGVFDLPEGTIYPALHRLERSRLVTSRVETHSGRQRRVYRLSAKGRAALAAQRLEWRQFSGAMASVLGLASA
jgi:DNA-binding PadR family transcriptional regulator